MFLASFICLPQRIIHIFFTVKFHKILVPLKLPSIFYSKVKLYSSNIVKLFTRLLELILSAMVFDLLPVYFLDED
jgi:hypothetical protein